MSKPKLNALEKLAILQEIESGQISLKAVLKKHGLASAFLDVTFNLRRRHVAFTFSQSNTY